MQSAIEKTGARQPAFDELQRYTPSPQIDPMCLLER